jgi:hypothetical protein
MVSTPLVEELKMIALEEYGVTLSKMQVRSVATFLLNWANALGKTEAGGTQNDRD